MTASTTNRFGKVGVLMGGRSAEREVSLKSGTMVTAALKSRGIDAHGFDTGLRSIAELPAEKFERVFIALHGRGGEDGTIQGALELLQIPYTGSDVLASAIAMDKVLSKRMFESNGLPTPAWRALSKADADRESLMGLPDALGLPLIVKPPHEGSTIGITKVAGYSQVGEAFELAARYDDQVLVEQFIEGDELTCAVLVRNGRAEALPVIRIVAPDGNYDYEHKYLSNQTQYLCPAGLDDATEHKVRELAVRAFDALGCAGWGRVDFMLARRGPDTGVPFLLEINTSPGMTDHSLVPMAARATGLEYADLVVEILSTAALHGRIGATPDHRGVDHVE
ncbi:D-alanine--D-alanine ligase [soil metagenome]